MMNLEQYRKKVQKRLTVMKILVGAYMMLMLTGGLLGKHPSASMLMGMGTGGGLVALVVIIQQSKALKDEKKLRQLYIQEHDERMMAIRQKAGYPVVVYLSLAVAAAAIYPRVYPADLEMSFATATTDISPCRSDCSR